MKCAIGLSNTVSPQQNYGGLLCRHSLKDFDVRQLGHSDKVLQLTTSTHNVDADHITACSKKAFEARQVSSYSTTLLTPVAAHPYSAVLSLLQHHLHPLPSRSQSPKRCFHYTVLAFANLSPSPRLLSRSPCWTHPSVQKSTLMKIMDCGAFSTARRSQ